MATPLFGEDTGVGYGVLGTSVPAVGVKGEGGKPPIVVRPGGGKDPASGVLGIHHTTGYGVYGSSVSGVGVHGSAYNNSASAVEGQHTGGGTGVSGSSPSGTGVSGTSPSGTGVAGQGSTGVSGVSKSGNGVYGASNTFIGVYGTCNNPSLGSIWGDSQVANGSGVVGNSVNGFAVWGQSTLDIQKLPGTNTPYNSVGVIGIADWGNGILGYAGTGSAVAGIQTDPNGLAGFFNGNVQITGNLTKGSSNFQIDHPLDPANKYLTHAAVESSEMKNFYDGVVKLNRKGEAEVKLPRWFAETNRDLRYQLTAIGAAAPGLHIASTFRDGKFRIAGGRGGMRVCWQVTGVRNDKWARKNPLVVEGAKLPRHRGKYLHPHLYGKKTEQGIGYMPVPKLRQAKIAGPGKSGK